MTGPIESRDVAPPPSVEPLAARAGLGLSRLNLVRCISPDGFNHELHSWSPAEWTNAVAGEVGEACNLAKKLIRHRDGVPGNRKPEDQDQRSLRRRMAEELADAVIYCDLAMQAVGFDLEATVREVFNRKSRELGAPYLIDGPSRRSQPVTAQQLADLIAAYLACPNCADGEGAAVCPEHLELFTAAFTKERQQ